MSEQVTGFADNWAYVRAELGWLDRVLMKAIARQKQQNQTTDRVAKSAKDKATNSWWLGFIDLDPAQGGRMLPKEPARPQQSRFSDRLALSNQVSLALPQLVKKCKLSEFERNLVILCLAPEINRRYEQLYVLLNNDGERNPQPSVDLALRLFCNSDQVWRQARLSFVAKAPLIKHRIISLEPAGNGAKTLISQRLYLQPKFVNFLLSDGMEISQIIRQPRAKISNSDLVLQT
ncbi:MAG: hypothetical protein SFT94_08420 [Pseudanabaenaceae cyanobacterium bins.68]|nr:hypothetical protein [Pseudanabaenaceae cyanobacterium bins.68]